MGWAGGLDQFRRKSLANGRFAEFSDFEAGWLNFRNGPGADGRQRWVLEDQFDRASLRSTTPTGSKRPRGPASSIPASGHERTVAKRKSSRSPD